MNRYKDGSVVRVKTTFVENDPPGYQAQVLGRDNIDPEQVFFMYSMTPQGASAQSGSATFEYGVGNEIQRDDTGRYRIDLPVSGWTSGGIATFVEWMFEGKDAGESIAVDTGDFMVEPTPFST